MIEATKPSTIKITNPGTIGKPSQRIADYTYKCACCGEEHERTGEQFDIDFPHVEAFCRKTGFSTLVKLVAQ